MIVQELSGDAVPAIFGELRLLALWPFGRDASVSCASLATPAARPPPAGSGVGVVRDRDERLRRGMPQFGVLTPVGAAAWSRSKAIFCATRDIATSALFFALVLLPIALSTCGPTEAGGVESYRGVISQLPINPHPNICML